MARALRLQRAEGGLDPELRSLMKGLDALRPKTRADCEDAPRPCPFAGCKYHLFIEVNPRTGSVKENFPGKDLDEIGDTCSLDVADRGGVTLEEIGGIMNMTQQGAAFTEARGLVKLRVLAEKRS